MKKIFSGKLIIFLTGLICFSSVWGSGSPALADDLKFGPWINLYNFYDVCYLEGKAWAVGNYGHIIFSDDGGKVWTRQESGVDMELYAVWFVTAQDGWVFGRAGLVLKTSDGGETWVKQDLNTDLDINACFFLDENTAWIVGAMNMVLYTGDGGKTWTRRSGDEDMILNGVYFCDQDFGWAVGEFGGILHTQDGGRTWEKQTHPCGEGSLFDVYFLNRNRGWVTGVDGVILGTNDGGATWILEKSHSKENLFRIRRAGNKMFVAGFKGSLLVNRDIEKAKASWDAVSIGCYFWFRGISFMDANTGILAGGNGNIFYTKDGGGSWNLAELLKY